MKLNNKINKKIGNKFIEEINESVISNLEEYLERLTVTGKLLKGYDVQIEQSISKEDKLEIEIVSSAEEYQEKIITDNCKVKETLRKNGIKDESISKGTPYQNSQTNINC